MRPSVRFVSTVLIVVGCAAGLPLTSAEPGVTGLKPVELPEGDGRDDVEAYCGACHSLRLVTQQRLSLDDWEAVLVTMVEEHGMSEIPLEDRTLALDYLAKHFGPDKPPSSPPLP